MLAHPVVCLKEDNDMHICHVIRSTVLVSKTNMLKKYKNILRENKKDCSYDIGAEETFSAKPRIPDTIGEKNREVKIHNI